MLGIKVWRFIKRWVLSCFHKYTLLVFTCINQSFQSSLAQNVISLYVFNSSIYPLLTNVILFYAYSYPKSYPHPPIPSITNYYYFMQLKRSV
jgi:hypothetical protein